MKLLLTLFLVISFQANATELNPKESEINQCQKDDDCIVVPYSHCCGSTKRAINRKFKKLYESNPEWRKFDDPKACALMGACIPDKNINKVKCIGNTEKICELIH